MEIRILQLIAFLQSGASGKLYNVSIYTGMNGIYYEENVFRKILEDALFYTVGF